jgi:hypothetical protein
VVTIALLFAVAALAVAIPLLFAVAAMVVAIAHGVAVVVATIVSRVGVFAEALGLVAEGRSESPAAMQDHEGEGEDDEGESTALHDCCESNDRY